MNRPRIIFPRRGSLSLLPERMVRRLLSCAVVAAVLRDAPAAVTNGAFDDGPDGLAGWNVTGQVFNTGRQAVLTDEVAGRSLVWQTVAGAAGPALFEFDVFTALAGVTVPGGLPDTLFATLYFMAEPAGFDPAVPGGAESFFAVADFDVSGVDAPTFLGDGAMIGPSAKGAAYRLVSFAFDHPGGFVAPVFEVNNLNGTAGDSVAAVDNVRLVFIPEPTVPMLLLPSALALVCARRRLPSTPPPIR